MVLQVQEAPMHRMDLLDGLLNMMAKKSKRESLLAMGESRQVSKQENYTAPLRQGPVSKQYITVTPSMRHVFPLYSASPVFCSYRSLNEPLCYCRVYG